MGFILEPSLRCQEGGEVQMSGSWEYESHTALQGGQDEGVNLGVISQKVTDGT